MRIKVSYKGCALGAICLFAVCFLLFAVFLSLFLYFHSESQARANELSSVQSLRNHERLQRLAEDPFPNSPPGWFLVTRGECGNISSFKNETNNDTMISFEYEVDTLVAFQDYPSHTSFTLEPYGTKHGVGDIMSPGWNNHNVALMSGGATFVFQMTDRTDLGNRTTLRIQGIVTDEDVHKENTPFSDGKCDMFIDSFLDPPDQNGLVKLWRFTQAVYDIDKQTGSTAQNTLDNSISNCELSPSKTIPITPTSDPNQRAGVFVYDSDQTCVLSIKGTTMTSWENVLDNAEGIFDVTPTGNDVLPLCEGAVHSGYFYALQTLRRDIDSTLSTHCQKYKLIITGHSLGAAVARLASCYLPNDYSVTELVTFGEPPSLKKGWFWAESFENYEKNAKKKIGKITRVVNGKDPVPTLLDTKYSQTYPYTWYNFSNNPLSSKICTTGESCLRFGSSFFDDFDEFADAERNFFEFHETYFGEHNPCVKQSEE